MFKPRRWLISRLMLLLMFYGVITPVALFFRMRGRDLLRRKRAGDQASYVDHPSRYEPVALYADGVLGIALDLEV